MIIQQNLKYFFPRIIHTVRYFYRYILIFLMIVLLFTVDFYYDLQSLLINIQMASRSADELINKLAERDVNSQEDKPVLASEHVNASDALAELMKLAFLNGVTIKQVKTQLSASADTGTEFAVLAVAEYTRIVNFLVALQKVQYYFFMVNFQLQIDKNGSLVLSLQLAPFKKLNRVDDDLVSAPTLKNNPFCTIKKLNDESDEAKLSNDEFALKEIKMIGFLQQKNQVFALVLMPSGRSLLLALGDKLGKEKAQVTRITPEQINLKLAAGAEFKITLQ